MNQQNFASFVRVASLAATFFFGRGITEAGTTPAIPPEIFCIGGVTETEEKWPVIPPGGIPWFVAAGPVNTKVAAGLPPNLCYPVFTSAPGVQSMVRAANTWSTAAIPGGAAPASTFALSPSPLPFGWANWTQNGADRMVQNGMNLVTCYQNYLWWQLVGGPSSLAATFVYFSALPPVNGNILESDIALNAHGEAVPFSGQPTFSLVENHILDGRTYATHTWDTFTGPYQEPILGYADLEGTMVHEFGHFAGLGHSLVDSLQNVALCNTPSMFPFAQVQPYAQPLSFYTGGGCGGGATYTTITPNASLTAFRGVLATPARTLEPDDIASLGEAYPSAAFNTSLGRITGITEIGSAGNSINGVHVVAYRADMVDAIRIGTFSRAGGAYTLRGLPPGEYYVYAEPVDQPVVPGAAGAHYFGTFDVPNYVFLFQPTAFPGCVGTFQQSFTTEFWNTAESFTDTHAMTANKVTVVAGVTIVGINFKLESQNDVLRVNPLANPAHRSPRGMIVSPQGAPHPMMEFSVDAGAAYAGRPCTLYFTQQRKSRLLNGQIGQVDITTAAVAVPGQNLDAFGRATFLIQSRPTLAYRNFFCQAVITGGPAKLSNLVNAWIASP